MGLDNAPPSSLTHSVDALFHGFALSFYRLGVSVSWRLVVDLFPCSCSAKTRNRIYGSKYIAIFFSTISTGAGGKRRRDTLVRVRCDRADSQVGTSTTVLPNAPHRQNRALLP